VVGFELRGGGQGKAVNHDYRLLGEGVMGRVTGSVFAVLFLCMCTTIPWYLPFGPSPAEAGGKNTLNLDNKSGEDAIVRVFDEESSRRIAEARVPTGRKHGTSVPDGRYYIVVKYIPQPKQDGKASPTYAKGDPFTIRPPAGKRSVVTITLHKVVNGNYSTVPTDEKAFER